MIPELELDAFRRFVSDVAASADGRVISNESADHAKIIIEQLIRSTREEVLILTHDLHPPVFASTEAIQATISLLETNQHAYVKVVSEIPIESNHPLLAALESRGLSQRVSVRRASAKNIEAMPCHFTIVDARHFRFEKDKRQFWAVTKFGEGVAGGKLKAVFDRLFEDSVEPVSKDAAAEVKASPGSSR